MVHYFFVFCVARASLTAKLPFNSEEPVWILLQALTLHYDIDVTSVGNRIYGNVFYSVVYKKCIRVQQTFSQDSSTNIFHLDVISFHLEVISIW